MGLSHIWNSMIGDPVKIAYNTGLNGTAEKFQSAIQSPIFENFRNIVEMGKDWGPKKHALIEGAFDAYKNEGRIENLQVLFSAEVGLFNASQRLNYYLVHRDYKTMAMAQDLLENLTDSQKLTRETIDDLFEKSAPRDKAAFLDAMLTHMVNTGNINQASAFAGAGVTVEDQGGLLYKATKTAGFTAKTVEALLVNETPQRRQEALDGALITAATENNVDSAMTLLSAGASAQSQNSKALQEAASQHKEAMMGLLLNRGASFEMAIYDSAARANYETFKTLQVYQKKMTGENTTIDIAPESKDEVIANLQEQVGKLTARVAKLEEAAQKPKVTPTIAKTAPRV